jgi:hypothetical protein
LSIFFEYFDDVATYLVLSKNIWSMSKQCIRIFFLTWMKYIEECFILIMLMK